MQGFIPRRILCTGFSLGGGLATIAALWAALAVPTADVRCITFGAPRVGNSDFVAAFVNSVGCQYRVVYEADPTPHHPRPVFYTHAGHPIWIHEGKFLFQVRRPRPALPAHNAGAAMISVVQFPLFNGALWPTCALVWCDIRSIGLSFYTARFGLLLH